MLCGSLEVSGGARGRQHVERLQAARELPPAVRVSNTKLLSDAAPQRTAARKLLRGQDGRNPVDGLGRTQGPLDLRLRSPSGLSGTAGMPLFSRSSHSLDFTGPEGWQAARTSQAAVKRIHCCSGDLGEDVP